MKIFASRYNPKYQLEIVLDIEPEEENIAASIIKHPKNISRKKMFSEQQLADYDDLIDTVVSIIQYVRFDILDEHQTAGTYSYYIDFYPTDENGDRWDKSIRIKFRISDHSNKGADNRQSNLARKKKRTTNNHTSRTYIESFVIGSKKYPDKRYVVSEVNHICEHLKKGDYSDFVQ